MAEIVLFHSALGLRPGVHALAEHVRAAGHRVHLPDLFDGEVFEDLATGVAKRDALGIPEIARRAATAVEDLSAELVYAGLSLGTGPAQMLAQTRPGARAALLLHGVLPAAAFGAPWPARVPLAIHTMDRDPWVDLDAARALASEAAHGELHLYPGEGHLFADPGLPEFDDDAASLLLRRTLAFLARV
jgi:dienelactone hydrolase